MDTARLMRDLMEGTLDGKESNLPAPLKLEFERKKKRLLFQLYAYVLAGLGVMYAGANILFAAIDNRLALTGAVLIILGFEITVLVKLAYGNIFTTLKTEQSIRELHLDLIAREESRASQSGKEE